ncbi:MAG TPA: hypothetical protein VFR36_08665 [Sphingomicrobium sp.]|nr:hypothetical protein [Sphingomicrobium sp.]
MPVACGTNCADPRYDRKESAMERQGDEIHLNETEATAGVKAHGVRYVLGFSLLLVTIAMSAIWILGSVLG